MARKHVFCEKPISLDLDSTVATIDAAREAGISLQVGFHRRFDPDWAAAAERIKSGELGDVYFFHTSLRDKEPPPLDYIRRSGGSSSTSRSTTLTRRAGSSARSKR